MQFLFSDLKNNRFIEKEEKINPVPFLGSPPDFVEFNSPVYAKVRAELINTEVLVSGEVSTFLTCSCARCLKSFNKKIEGDFKQSFEGADDIIDVSTYIKEAVILEFPIKAVCEDDCLGLCPTCGKNKNEVKCNCPSTDVHPGLDVLKEFKFPN